MDSLIPIVAILSSIGLPAVVAIIIVLALHRQKIARYNVIEKAIESSASPEVVEKLINSLTEDGNRKSSSPRQKHLMHGTLLLALGLSMFVITFIVGGTGNQGLPTAGAILTMLALAKFVIALFIIGKPPVQP